MAKEIFKSKGKPLRARNKVLREEKARRQAEAAARQEAYNALTLEQKIAKLDAKGYVAAKQRIKLAQPSAGEKIVQALTEAVTATPEPEPPKEKKGAKARRQERKDKKGAK